MRRILNNSNLLIDQNTYYNLIRDKSLDKSNNSFEGLILVLKKINFKFICLINNKLVKNNSIKKRILEQLFFIIDV